MRNNIIERQNEDSFIRLLKAQRVAYSQAKKCKITEVISVLVAVLMPILPLSEVLDKEKAAIISVVWLICALILDRVGKSITEKGARIQEEFDTLLFDLYWLKTITGNKVNADEITEYAKKYTKDDLSNWYSIEIKPILPHNIAVLLCQRTNLNWDVGLRKKYITTLLVFFGGYYGLFIGVYAFHNLGVYDFFLSVVAPSLPFCISGVQNIKNQREIIKNKSRVLDEVNELWEKYQIKQKKPPKDKLREIQTVIYTERKSPSKIPDWFYWAFKERNETTTDETIKAMIMSIQTN